MTLPDDAPGLKITRHARQRFKERSGLPVRSAVHTAQQALLHGLPAGHSDVPEGMGYWLHNRQRKAEAASEGGFVLLHKHVAYVFAADQTLITVLPDPRGTPDAPSNDHDEPNFFKRKYRRRAQRSKRTVSLGGRNR